MEKKFKHLLYGLLMCCMAVSLTACGGNEDEPDSIESQLVGTWTNNVDTTITFRANRTGKFTYCGETENFKDWTYNHRTTEVDAYFTSGLDKGRVCQLCHVSGFTGNSFHDSPGGTLYVRK